MKDDDEGRTLGRRACWSLASFGRGTAEEPDVPGCMRA
jgi:hypothetical protein